MSKFENSEYHLAAEDIRDAGYVYGYELVQILSDKGISSFIHDDSSVENALCHFSEKGGCLETDRSRGVIIVPCVDEACVPAVKFLPLVGELFLSRLMGTHRELAEAVELVNAGLCSCTQSFQKVLQWIAGSLFAIRHDSEHGTVAFDFCCHHMDSLYEKSRAPLYSCAVYTLWKEKEELKTLAWRKSLEGFIADYIIRFCETAHSINLASIKDTNEHTQRANRVH